MVDDVLTDRGHSKSLADIPLSRKSTMTDHQANVDAPFGELLSTLTGRYPGNRYGRIGQMKYWAWRSGQGLISSTAYIAGESRTL